MANTRPTLTPAAFAYSRARLLASIIAAVLASFSAASESSRLKLTPEMLLLPARTSASSTSPRMSRSLTLTFTSFTTRYPTSSFVLFGRLSNCGLTRKNPVWMSFSAIPASLSTCSTRANLRLFSDNASFAVFAIVVTPVDIVARSGGALALPSPRTLMVRGVRCASAVGNVASMSAARTRRVGIVMMASGIL
ncbi:unnamed protein product [Chondrus crispus]|uniref:Uncharacterized protein n=1 Tax=Chondrus crispus TaxID=2769 RepID=R7QAV1_CHOCR|nr:unnamed protein product [Chondrus crispus]CDF34913.1 unnamed protein product [Chondrus crispus]|eukprot:XP_005714732.1 unnamed protein product [Chondrus crispus]